jgi:YcaO-like protein with predicted kinase domain
MLDVNASAVGFASCVVQLRTDDALWCLGPALRLVELARDVATVEDLDDEGIEALRAMRFLDQDEGAECSQPSEPSATADAYVVTTDAAEGRRLVECLCRIDGVRTWDVIADPNDLSRVFPGATLVVAQPREDLALRFAADAVARGFSVLWSGETTEGVHLGPLFRRPGDIEPYRAASFGHAFAGELRRYGFATEWPCSLLQSIARDPAHVAQVVVELLDRAAENPFLCYELESSRFTQIWGAVLMTPIAPGAVAEQCWDKGLFRSLEVRPIDDVPSVFVATCRTPPSGVAYLESNSGKGFSAEKATRGAIGEAVERFAAWRANEVLQLEVIARQRLALSAFHPFGPHYDSAYNALLPATTAHDVRTGEAVAVPACLVPFPYVHHGAPSTVSSTIGLAVHPDREAAVAAAALELIERDDFLTGFTEGRIGEAIRDADALGPDVSRLLNAASRAGLRVTVLRYAAGVPYVVHAVLHDSALGGVAFGSGSSTARLADAVERALTEALQLREQLRRVVLEPAERRGRFDDCSEWLEPSFVGAALRHAAAAAPVLAAPENSVSDSTAALDSILNRIERLGSRLLVVELPSPVRSWSAVRALAPGLCLHPHRSDSAGGRRLPRGSLVARSEQMPPRELEIR